MSVAEYSHCSGHGDSVEVSDLQRHHSVAVPLEADAVEVAELTLQEEKEPSPRAVQRRRDYKHFRRRPFVAVAVAVAARQRGLHWRLALSTPAHAVCAAHKHAPRAILPPRTPNNNVRTVVDRVAPAACHVVEAEVKLVERQDLLRPVFPTVCGGAAVAATVVHFTVVELKRCKHRVVKADINSAEVEQHGRTLVRLEG